jgi:hypothetical protein
MPFTKGQHGNPNGRGEGKFPFLIFVRPNESFGRAPF